MKFNTKTRYGLRTVLELALNEGNKAGILQKDIAENQDVSVKYLDQIISSLKKSGLVINKSGKKSGYILTRPSRYISVYDVYLAFENEMEIIPCLSPGGECARKDYCVLRGFWCELNESIIDKMKSANLYDLSKRNKNLVSMRNKNLE